jgi:hypothetical protein
MTKPLAYNYPPGTTPEAIEAFRTMWGQTPEDDVRLGSTFETFLRGFVSGRMYSMREEINWVTCNLDKDYNPHGKE